MAMLYLTVSRSLHTAVLPMLEDICLKPKTLRGTFCGSGDGGDSGGDAADAPTTADPTHGMFGGDVVETTTGVSGFHSSPRPPLTQLPPDAVGDRLQGTEDTVKVIPLNQLLQNDSDPNGDGLSVTGIGNAVGGTAVLVDGQVVFTPDPDFNGEASFTYTISDGHGGSDTATAVIDVAAVNDGPVLEMEGFTFATTEQVTSRFQHDIANFIDVLTDVQEGQPLDASFVNGAAFDLRPADNNDDPDRMEMAA